MKPGAQPGWRHDSPAGCCWVNRKSLRISGRYPFEAGLPRSSAQYHSAKMITLVVQILRASSSSVRPLPALPAATTRRASAPKFISVTRAVNEMASRSTISRWRPTRFHCSSVDALRARLCVHTVAIDSGIRSASSSTGASHRTAREPEIERFVRKVFIGLSHWARTVAYLGVIVPSRRERKKIRSLIFRGCRASNMGSASGANSARSAPELFLL